MFVFGMLCGFCGAILLFYFAINQIEDEAYMEGYKDGWKAGEENDRTGKNGNIG